MVKCLLLMERKWVARTMCPVVREPIVRTHTIGRLERPEHRVRDQVPPHGSRLLRTDNILVSLHPSSVLTAFVFLSALQSNVVRGLLNRMTARTLSARVFFPLRRSQLSGLLRVIRMPPKTNIGCFKRPSMDYVTVPVIGMRKLIPFSVRLASRRTHTTHASTLVSCTTLAIHRLLLHLFHYRWVCSILINLFISRRILRWNHLFKRLLRECVKVDFMGLVEWFLGIHFSWRMTSSRVDVHLNQTGFATNLVEQFCCDSWDATPTATPYCSGVPIDSIAPSIDADDSPAQLRQTEAYQSLVGSIGWLTTATRPDWCTLSSRLTIANRLLATCVLLSTISTIFTRLTTLGYTSHRLLRTQFTRLFLGC